MRLIEHTLAIGCMMILLGCSNSSFSNSILPNHNMLGSKIDSRLDFFDKRIVSDKHIYPEGINLDIQEGIVIGMRFVYANSVAYQKLVDELNRLYGKCLVERFDSKMPYIQTWRVETEKFSIMLEKNEKGKVILIFLKWIQNEELYKKLERL